MGRSQVLFNRRKGRTGGGAGGRGAPSGGGTAHAGEGKGAGRGRDVGGRISSSNNNKKAGARDREEGEEEGIEGGGTGRHLAGLSETPPARKGRGGQKQPQQLDAVALGASTSSRTGSSARTSTVVGSDDDDDDDENDDGEHDYVDTARSSYLPASSSSCLVTSASASTTVVTLGMAAARKLDRSNDDIDDDDDDDAGGRNSRRNHHRHQPCSFTGLDVSAMGAALRQLSVAEQYQIPQHLVDTMFVDEREPKDSSPKKSTDEMPPETVTTSVQVQLTSESIPARPRRHQPQPLLQVVGRRRIASVSSELLVVSSGEYDAGDEDDAECDSDAILRSRKSSSSHDDDHDGEECSTLPSTVAPAAAAAAAAAEPHPTRGGRDANHPDVVVQGRTVLPVPQTGHSNYEQVKVAPPSGKHGPVAAIIRSISDELYAVDQVISEETSVDDEDIRLGVVDSGALLDSSESNAAGVLNMSIPPSDTMQAVVIATRSSTTNNTHESSYRSIPTSSDTARAVASNPSAATTSGIAILRPSDTMQAVVDGRPVHSSERTDFAAARDDGLFPPNLMLSMALPSPGTIRTTASASPARKLVLSPGRVPAYPIDLSAAPSPPHDDHHHHHHLLHEHHSFAVPEDRIRTLANVPGGSMVGTTSDLRPLSTWQRERHGRSVSPYATGRAERLERGGGEVRRAVAGDRDVIERARIAIAASSSGASASAPRGQHVSVLGQGRPHPQPAVGIDLPRVNLPPVIASGSLSRASGGMSADPDSDDAVAGMPTTSRSYSRIPRDDPHTSTTPRAQHSPTQSRGGAPATAASPPREEEEELGAASPPRFVMSPPSTNLSSRGDEDDYDTWLESALATRTFDDPAPVIGGGSDTEPLHEWLDSVLP